MSDTRLNRKRLATIVAIDVAGYSRRVESDETGALTAVQDLHGQIRAIAEAHEGRVFNTAGDGFMLEFPTVTGGLEAADAIRAQALLPLRTGVHVGEVSVTGQNDLLGHGVNVAARLQARAPLNGILVSADVVRAVRGDLGRRFAPFGRIRLSKMQETLAVYTFGPEDAVKRIPLSPLAFIRRFRGPVLAVLAIAAVLAAWGLWRAAAPAGLFGLQPASQARGGQSLRVAAKPLDILGGADPDLQKFAGGLRAEMVRQLSQSQIDVVSPAAKDPAPGQGAAYVFGGSVERQGHDIVVRLQLDDARQHVTVWSDEYRDDAAHADRLQDTIGSESSQVASVAVHADSVAKGDTDAMAMMIKDDIYAMRNRDDEREAAWENQKLLLAKFPDSVRERANFAVLSGFLAASSTPERAAELRALAAKEADAALKIDPRSDFAYLARALAFPLVGHWREREGFMLTGLKAMPDSVLLANHESNFLREVGRLDEALIWARRAAAPKPPSPNRNATLLLALAAAGQDQEAAVEAADDAQAWPTHAAVWNGRLELMIFQQRWSDALALFGPGTYRPTNLNEAESRAWIGALKAMNSGRPGEKRDAARALAAIPMDRSTASLPPHEIYSPGNRIAMLAILGADEEAFAEAQRYLAKDAYADSAFLFWPNLAPWRRDKRFFQLLSSIGLVAYWRTAGREADFCSDPKLPYACDGKMKTGG